MLFKANTCSPDEIAKPVTEERGSATSHCCYHWPACDSFQGLRESAGSGDHSDFPGSTLIIVWAFFPLSLS